MPIKQYPSLITPKIHIMKPKWVATLNARFFEVVFQCSKILYPVLFIISTISITSCDRSDEIEPFGYESTLDNESPPGNGSHIGDKPKIIYTDIEPDLTSENIKDSYNLDLNNDQITDFTVSVFSDTLEEWLLIASKPNATNGIISVAPWYTHTVPLNSGKEIYNLRGYRDGEFYETWSLFNVGRCFGGDPDCPYDWKNKVDKYLGLRFIIKGKTHFGWARMDVSSPTQWIIKDYAYNATPNLPILAGQLE